MKNKYKESEESGGRGGEACLIRQLDGVKGDKKRS